MCHVRIINLYAKYVCIFKFGRILRSPDSRSNYPNPILRRISSLTTLLVMLYGIESWVMKMQQKHKLSMKKDGDVVVDVWSCELIKM